ncbi:MAG: DUF5673 domain-containing protein [Thermoplasmata archaeon]
MNLSDIGVLLRIVAFVIIIMSIVFLKNRRVKGKIIFQWKTTVKRELLNNILNINMFTIAVAVIIIFDDVLIDVIWYKIFIDIALLACIIALLLIPKHAIIADRGILFMGIFRPWTSFSRYRINKMNKTIVLWQNVLFFSEKIIIPIEDVEKVEKILSKYIHNDIFASKSHENYI